MAYDTGKKLSQVTEWNAVKNVPRFAVLHKSRIFNIYVRQIGRLLFSPRGGFSLAVRPMLFRGDWSAV